MKLLSSEGATPHTTYFVEKLLALDAARPGFQPYSSTGAAKMGRQATKPQRFVSISLEDYVPQDHLLRAVGRFLDPSEFREGVAAPIVIQGGHPSQTDIET